MVIINQGETEGDQEELRASIMMVLVHEEYPQPHSAAARRK